jgi:hypothetical protein
LPLENQAGAKIAQWRGKEGGGWKGKEERKKESKSSRKFMIKSMVQETPISVIFLLTYKTIFIKLRAFLYKCDYFSRYEGYIFDTLKQFTGIVHANPYLTRSPK